MRSRQLKLTRVGPMLIGSIFLLTYGLALIINIQVGNTIVQRSQSNSGRAMHAISSRLLSDPLLTLDMQTVEGMLGQFVAESDVAHAAVRNSNGQIIAQAGGGWVPQESVSEEIATQAMARQELVQREIGRYLMLSGPIGTASEQIGTLEIVFDKGSLINSLRPIQTAGALMTLAFLLAAILLITFLVRYFTRPLRELTTIADEISRGNMDVSITPTHAIAELSALETAFEIMRSELNELYLSLEARVTARTRALEASTEVSRRLSTILDPVRLVSEVVELVRGAFDYYHAHIYLWDEAGEYLVMAGGTGEAGRTMLRQRHKIPKGKGLVGRAAATNAVVLVPVVSKAAGWLPNPLLPDTRAEVAVPISMGDQVLGVLDVQQNVADSLTSEDARLLQSVASQVAVALRNARSYQQAQQQGKREAMINAINQKIQNANTLDGVLRVTAQELGKALKARRTSIQIGTTAQNGDARP